jgi:hypothetical protein
MELELTGAAASNEVVVSAARQTHVCAAIELPTDGATLLAAEGELRRSKRRKVTAAA